MKRPNAKKYSPKDFLRGKYEDDLEKYIDYLERWQSINSKNGKLPIQRVSNAKRTFGADDMLGFAEHCYLHNIPPTYDKLHEWSNK